MEAHCSSSSSDSSPPPCTGETEPCQEESRSCGGERSLSLDPEADPTPQAEHGRQARTKSSKVCSEPATTATTAAVGGGGTCQTRTSLHVLKCEHTSGTRSGTSSGTSSRCSHLPAPCRPAYYTLHTGSACADTACPHSPVQYVCVVCGVRARTGSSSNPSRSPTARPACPPVCTSATSAIRNLRTTAATLAGERFMVHCIQLITGATAGVRAAETANSLCPQFPQGR